MSIDPNILKIFQKVCNDKNITPEFEKELQEIIENWDEGKDITKDIENLLEEKQ
jgi:hypothetical protein